MSIKKNINIILIIFNVLITLIILPFLPQSIPMHYNMHSNINRWGNKYEIIIFPVFLIIFSLFLYFVNKFSSDDDLESLYYICPSLLLLYNFQHIVFLYKAYFSQSNEPIFLDINQLTFFSIGLFMINLGIILPKFKKNYGGKILIIFGLAIVVGNLFLQKSQGFYFSIMCFILIIPITLLLTKN